MRKLINIIALTVILISGAFFSVQSADSGKWQVISGGGNTSSSADYQLTGTIGQNSVGISGATSLSLKAGFWQKFGDGFICNCSPGDANFDEVFNIVDITYLISYMYEGGPPPLPMIICSADPNIDCVSNILDITSLIRYLYHNGQELPTCEEWYTLCMGK